MDFFTEQKKGTFFEFIMGLVTMMAFMLFIYFFVGCARYTDSKTNTIREVEKPIPTPQPIEPSPPLKVVTCYRGSQQIYGPVFAFTVVAMHDWNGSLFYEIEEYPARNLVRVYGQCIVEK